MKFKNILLLLTAVFLLSACKENNSLNEDRINELELEVQALTEEKETLAGEKQAIMEEKESLSTEIESLTTENEMLKSDLEECNAENVSK